MRLAKAVGAVLLLVAVAWLALLSWLPTDEVLAEKATTALQTALGSPVTVGAVSWHFRPTPLIEVTDVVVGGADLPAGPIKIDRLTAYLSVSSLWQREIKARLLVLDGAVVPQRTLRAITAQRMLRSPSAQRRAQATAAGAAADPAANAIKNDKTASAAMHSNADNAPSAPDTPAGSGGFALADVPVERVVFSNVSWESYGGIASLYAGDARFDGAWRPSRAYLERPGAATATHLTATRQGADDAWAIAVAAGGGTANGQVQLKTLASGQMQLSGQLKPRGIEVQSALEAFNRQPVLSGQLSGDMQVSSSGYTAGELTQGLRTLTTFALQPAALLRFDLSRAIRTLGAEHAGQTRLDTLSGQLATQNTPQGMAVEFIDIRAKSGVLSASGHGTLANRFIKAELSVDLVDGLVGVPLTVAGPVGAVKVSMPTGAAVGAAVGTVVLPGVGTAIGAKLGAALGRLFGGPSPPLSSAAPASAPATTPAPARSVK